MAERSRLILRPVTLEGSPVTERFGVQLRVNAPVRVLSDGDDVEGGGPVISSTGQEVDESTGTVQTGSTEVNAPVRVMSEGENGTTSESYESSAQSSEESVGTVQTGTVQADAPVRVASDGDDGAPASSTPDADGGQEGAGGTSDQNTEASAGTAQIGSADADAPVRVLSSGDNGAGGRVGAR